MQQADLKDLRGAKLNAFWHVCFEIITFVKNLDNKFKNELSTHVYKHVLKHL